MHRVLAFSLLLFAGCLSASAEFFARDKNTILEIENTDEGKPHHYQLTVYGSPEEDGVVYGYGNFKSEEAGVYIAVSSDKSVLEILRNKDGSLKVSAKGFVYSGGVHAKQPFDASGVYKPISDSQILTWAKKRYEAADTALNALYSKVISGNPERAKELRKLQRDWIWYRDDMAAFGPEDPKEKSPTYWSQMATQTAVRIGFLKAWSGALEVNDSISGTYSDFRGGNAVIDTKKAKLKFQIEVVRGPSSHLGQIEGTASLKGTKGEYSDGKNPPALLRFSFQPNHVLRIEGENTEEYHGARAYFDGTYYKVSDDAEMEEFEQ